MRFIKEEKHTGARLGILHTPHGSFPTPMYMPVGTLATIKGLSPEELKEMGADVVLANTYHLWLRPGEDLVAEAGGLHKFMNWDKGILTDSGGFQVFSLSDMRKITEEGVHFRNHINGEKLFLSPEKAIHIENQLGADIIMSFDECPPFDQSYDYVKRSIERTTRWAERGLRAHQRPQDQALFGILQGAGYKDLRLAHAQDMIAMDFPGYSIGGLSVGESKEEMNEVLDYLTPVMPKHKPRYLMGVGTPQNILEGIERGVDMFDCVMPTRNGRNAMLFTYEGTMNMRNKKWENDFSPVDSNGCDIDIITSKAYLHHLFKAGELLAMQIASIHNIAFYLRLVTDARTHIEKGDFTQWKSSIMDKLGRRL